MTIKIITYTPSTSIYLFTQKKNLRREEFPQVFDTKTLSLRIPTKIHTLIIGKIVKKKEEVTRNNELNSQASVNQHNSEVVVACQLPEKSFLLQLSFINTKKFISWRIPSYQLRIILLIFDINNE